MDAAASAGLGRGPRGTPAGVATTLFCDAADGAAEQVVRVDAQLAQLVSVLIGVDGVGQQLVGLRDLVVLTVSLEMLQNLLLADLHQMSPVVVRTCVVVRGLSAP